MPLENTDAEERITRETMIGWIEHWGESYDDVRPDDGAVRLANRIIEYNAAVEAIEALRNPDAVYDELASVLQPVLSSMDGTYFAGSEWFAGEVDRMEAGRINGGAAGRNGRPGLRRAPHPVHRGERGHSRRYGRAAVGRADHRSHARIFGLGHDPTTDSRNMCAPPGATRQPTTGRSSWPNSAPRANGRPTRTGSPCWA